MATLAQRIISAICSPYAISGQNIIIGASIGIAVIDRNCGTATDIMRYADMALYRAKNEGRNRPCIYDAAMDADLSTRKLLEADLREAIDSDQLQLLSAGRQQERRYRGRRGGALPLGNIRPAARSRRPNSSRLPSTAD